MRRYTIEAFALCRSGLGWKILYPRRGDWIDWWLANGLSMEVTGTRNWFWTRRGATRHLQRKLDKQFGDRAIHWIGAPRTDLRVVEKL